jgi:hypothetical protein
MPVIGKGAPNMRNHIAWDMLNRRCNSIKPEPYIKLHVHGSDDRAYPQLDWHGDGSMIVRRTGTRIIRGVVLVDVLDVDNANLNGWFVQSRATTDDERKQGLVRVARV